MKHVSTRPGLVHNQNCFQKFSNVVEEARQDKLLLAAEYSQTITDNNKARQLADRPFISEVK